MKKKKMVALFGAVVLALSLLVGCQTQGSTEENAENIGTSNQAEGTYTVKVTAIDGNQIKAQPGALQRDGQGDNQPPPQDVKKPEGEGGQDDNRQPPQDGAPSFDNGDGFGSFTESGEEIIFIITDSTTITVESMPDRQVQPGEKPEAVQPEEADNAAGEDRNAKKALAMEPVAGTIDDIAVDSILEVVLDENNTATSVLVKSSGAGFGGDGNFGGSDTVTNGTAAVTISEDTSVEAQSYQSSGDDENALRIDGCVAAMNKITVEKTGGSSSNTENGDFYGQNAGLLALNGADVTIDNAFVNTSAVNGNGVFCYGEGTKVSISDSVIHTTENNSGGIQTTGGGTMSAKNLTVETKGNSAAAIRTDRGGGTVNVEGGTYTTNGTGSPAVYCTADITVTDSELTANASEGVVVEGRNSVALKNCVVTANMDNTYHGDEDENIHGIMIYQSMSGDAQVGEASFLAEGGSISVKQGDAIYVTNTDCNIELKNVDIELANDTLLRVEGNTSSRGWGKQGENGGAVVMTAANQLLEGNILVDIISSLDLTLSDNTAFVGAINPEDNGGTVNVTISKDSSWTLTGDTYITKLDGDTGNINANGYHLYVGGKQIL
ncbi:MAG: hypothetical protein K2G89_00165 [Lachnospiraceae bacterium]|nr:hypothetical protein [Lachnospiraceae bacterium]